MAAGDIHLNSDGTIALDATGKIRIQDGSGDCPDCCGGCTTGTQTCSTCTDVVPDEYEVTFDGITLCSCEATGDGLYVAMTWLSGDVLNTSHTLTADGSCRWKKTLSNAVHVVFSFDNDCTPNDGNFIDVEDDLIILLERKATTWELTVANGGGDGFAFYDIQTADTDAGSNQLCATVPSFENDNTDCTYGSFYALAHSGNGTVVCL